MKLKFILISFCILATLVSCIKDEAKNREADIEKFELPGTVMFGSIIDEDNNTIEILVKKDVSLANLTPTVVLSPGATISPGLNEPQDFSKQLKYTVTSEDGNWKRVYIVDTTAKIQLHYTFDDWTITSSKYYNYTGESGWASGNPGLALIKPDTFPTRPTDDRIEGTRAAMLITQEGGYISFIKKNIPIFAGSLFRGKFYPLNAIKDPLTCPNFGYPHTEAGGKPISLTGHYKYKVGAPFIDKEGNEVPGRLDSCTIRGVLYKVTKGKGSNEYLTAKDILTSDKIVAMADLKDCSEQLNWTEFTIPFVYREEINFEEHDYKLAIIFASSKDGDHYEGAIGSTLKIDDVRVLSDLINK